VQAVVLNLFGTRVMATTPEKRPRPASRVADVAGCDTTTVEGYFLDTAHVRQNSTLPTLPDLAAYLVQAVHGPDAAAHLPTCLAERA
jgi:ribosomal protein L10